MSLRNNLKDINMSEGQGMFCCGLQYAIEITPTTRDICRWYEDEDDCLPAFVVVKVKDIKPHLKKGALKISNTLVAYKNDEKFIDNNYDNYDEDYL